MLKNKNARREYLSNSFNWSLVLKKEELCLTVLKTKLPNNTIIYKIIFNSTYINHDYLKDSFEDITYRVKMNDNMSEIVSMTYLIDLLGKI